MAKRAKSKTSKFLLKGIVDPNHLLAAIKNSIDHSSATAHQVTGVHFKRYSVIVSKALGTLDWRVQVRFKKHVER